MSNTYSEIDRFPLPPVATGCRLTCLPHMPTRSPAHFEQVDVNDTILVLHKKRQKPKSPNKSIYKNVYKKKKNSKFWKAQFTNSEGKTQALKGKFKTEKEAAVAVAFASKFGINAGSPKVKEDDPLLGSQDVECEFNETQVSSSPEITSPISRFKIPDDVMDSIMEGPNQLLKSWAAAHEEPLASLELKANQRPGGRKRRRTHYLPINIPVSVSSSSASEAIHLPCFEHALSDALSRASTLVDARLSDA